MSGDEVDMTDEYTKENNRRSITLKKLLANRHPTIAIYRPYIPSCIIRVK